MRSPAEEPSDDLFRLAFLLAPGAAAVVDLDGRLLAVNRRFSELLQTDEASLVGIPWRSFVDAADTRAFDEVVAGLTRGELDEGGGEVRLRTAGGRVLHAQVSGAALRDPATGRVRWVVAQVSDVSPDRRARRELVHRATHDPLTGLPNRSHLIATLEEALASARGGGADVAVLFCDLDRFKRVNDSLGHAGGDRLLVEVARLLAGAVGPGETVGRLGGDEFLVVAPVADHRAVEELLGRLRRATAAPVRVDEHPFVPSLSIGLVVSDGAAAATDVIEQADTAMYEAKERGRGRTEEYDDQLRARAAERLQLETELRRGIGLGELRLHHQPIVDLADRTVLGREALVRWAHPDHGLLAPAAFLDVAGDAGLLGAIGSWVLERATREAVALRDRHGPAKVGINVAAGQLEHPDLRGEVERALEASGLPSAALVLELTETAMLHATPRMLAEVRALSSTGVSLAIDDFGTGYSSLTYLRTLPVDIVKIDRSFVAEITTDRSRVVIVDALLRLGASLGIDVVVEGIETDEQLELLTDLGATMGQGHLLGRPAPLDVPDPSPATPTPAPGD